MLNKLKRIIRVLSYELVNLGVDKSMSTQEAIPIRSVNILSILWIPSLLCLDVFCLTTEFWMVGICMFFLTTFLFLVPVMNVMKHTNASMIIYSTIVNINIALPNLFFNFHYKIFFLWFPFIFSLPLLYIHKRNGRSLNFHILSSVLIHVCVFIIVLMYPVNSTSIYRNDVNEYLIFFLSITNTLIVLWMGCNIYLKLNKKYAKVVRSHSFLKEKHILNYHQREQYLTSRSNIFRQNLEMLTIILSIIKHNSNDIKEKEYLNEIIRKFNIIFYSQLKLKTLRTSLNINMVDGYDSFMQEYKKFPIYRNYPVSIQAKIDNAEIHTINSTLVSIIVYELLNNSIQHGFKDIPVEQAEIHLIIQKVAEYYVISYSDNGKGFDADSVSYRSGMSLIEISVEKLQGKYEFNTEFGTTFSLTFK